MKMGAFLICIETCLNLGARLVHVDLPTSNRGDSVPLCMCEDSTEKFYVSAFEGPDGEYDSGCELYSYEADNRGPE